MRESEITRLEALEYAIDQIYKHRSWHRNQRNYFHGITHDPHYFGIHRTDWCSLKQRELAERFLVNPTTIGKYERLLEKENLIERAKIYPDCIRPGRKFRLTADFHKYAEIVYDQLLRDSK